MWKKTLAILAAFYLFALLQSNFFAHFYLFGAGINLVFILFFLLLFYSSPMAPNYRSVLLASFAGFFLDVFSHTHIGPSMLILVVGTLLFRKTQLLLRNREETYPFFYFLPLFVAFLLFYTILLAFYFSFFDQSGIALVSVWNIFWQVIYNTMVASAVFYIYKKIKHGKNL